MSREEELYTHFQECLASLNRAWSILSELDDNQMPFGIQILSAPGNDRLVIEVAKGLEAALAKNTLTQRPIPNLDKLSV